ncbi:MAG TPA: ATP-binding protein [Bacilli bacterium]|nr:ATP-binding protein [Bacilli bacterium]
MFQKIRWQLTALNALVLLAILILSGVTLYVYMEHRLMERVDLSLRVSAKPYYAHEGRVSNPPIPIGRKLDQQVAVLMWGTHGELVSQYPERAVYEEDEAVLRQALDRNEPQTVTLNEHTYRTLTVPLDNSLVIRTPIGDYPLGSIQLVRNIDSEAELLHGLLLYLVIGGGVGTATTVGAGLFLAGRALVPIRRSWDRQQQFVADASHELRTPLAVIQTHGELMLRHPDHTVQEESEHLAVVLQESRRLNKLVSALLLLARSDSNQVELEIRPVRLTDLLQETAEPFRQVAEMEQVAFQLELEEMGTWSGDEARLRQLFVILLDNALSYTPEGGRVTVRCRRQPSQLLIEVQDTGIGIAKEDLPRIYDRFYRGDKARTRSSGGTGLGLSIAKWVVEKHRGRIEIDSEAGAGTTVRVMF